MENTPHPLAKLNVGESIPFDEFRLDLPPGSGSILNLMFQKFEAQAVAVTEIGLRSVGEILHGPSGNLSCEKRSFRKTSTEWLRIS